MGLKKMGTTLGKEISSWLNAAGKTTIVQTKLVGKINSEGLKYRPKLECDIVQISKAITKTNPIKRAGTILNTKTGLQEPITFSDLPSEIDKLKTYYLDAYNQSAETIGKVSFKMLNLRRKAPCLYIDYLGTAEGYKGVGSEIIRKLVQLSDKLGLEGRISLEASTGNIPSHFRFKGFADKCKTSAAIKYKKMGFVADKWTEKNLQKEIASGGNGFARAKSGFGEYDRDLFGGTQMELSEEAIKRFLEGI